LPHRGRGISLWHRLQSLSWLGCGCATMPPRHLAVGNLNLDMYVVVDYIPGPDENSIAREAYLGPGGAAANYAVTVTGLGHEAGLVSHTGSEAGRLGLLRALRERGVDTSHIVIHEGEMPGLVIILVAKDGERTMITMRGANNYLRGDEAAGEKVDALHVASRGTEVFTRAASSISARLVSYDPGASNARREGPKILEVARNLADVLVLNRVEYGYVSGGAGLSVARSLLGGRLGMIIVKLGAQGAVLFTREGAWRVEAYRAGEPVDTTGAGDVFIATFNVFYLDTDDPLEALKAASIAAGMKVTRRGAQSAPGREEVERILRTSPPAVKRLQ